MKDRLFPLLVALCLLDLGFVHATAVVDTMFLWPLWALTAGAPWLRHLQRHRLHRIGWNSFVLVVFALLVHHATTTGLLHMLEDGLVLAALCQVHLLNNVGERQRPDLVFFNSFLIAFVTSFFAPDVVWSVLFIAHAFVLVPGLQRNCLARHPAAAAAPRLATTRLWRDGFVQTSAIGIVTAFLFVLIPRDWNRQGWLGEALANGHEFSTGLAERIEIGNEHTLRLGEEVAFTIAPASGRVDDVPTHWRALAFTRFDGSAWDPQNANQFGSRFATDRLFERQRDGSMRRDGDEAGTSAAAAQQFEVRLADVGSDRLPMPLRTTGIRVEAAAELLFDPRSDGGVRLLVRNGAPPARPAVWITTGKESRVADANRVRLHLTQLPERGVPDVVRTLAQHLRAALPADADEWMIASACRDWLQNERRYQLPGGPGFARNLGEFLLGSGAGHCEYFATALALLLRVQDVPCRLVGGYLAHETDPNTPTVIVRAKHAHAWVEVLADDGSWHTCDATPAADVAFGNTAPDSVWAAFSQKLDELWRGVTGFDQAARARWLGTLAQLPTQHPMLLASVLAAGIALVYLRRRRQRPLPSIHELQRAVRAAGLSLKNGETPRELLVRAANGAVAPAALARLQSAAFAHERHRYAGPPAIDRP